MKVKKEKRDGRKKDTHEYFTPPELVERMIKKFPPEMWQVDKTFIDPNMGDGNLLVAVLEKKVDIHHHDPIKALSTIYGIELMSDNTAVAKLRLYKMVIGYLEKDNKEITSKRKKIIQHILDKNIVCHDALTYDWSFGEKIIN